MKDAIEIAQQVLDAHAIRDDWRRTGAQVRQLIIEAVDLDREQHNMITALAAVLDDRDAHAAAQLVRDTDPDDDLWNNYVGPMIDSVEDDYTKLAGEVEWDNNEADDGRPYDLLDPNEREI
jgi:hypothetical protein